MQNFIKKYRNAIILTVLYVLIADAVYACISYSLWHSPLITILVTVLLTAIGGTIGYFYSKMIIKEKEEEEAKAEEAKAEEQHE